MTAEGCAHIDSFNDIFGSEFLRIEDILSWGTYVMPEAYSLGMQTIQFAFMLLNAGGWYHLDGYTFPRSLQIANDVLFNKILHCTHKDKEHTRRQELFTFLLKRTTQIKPAILEASG